MTAVPVERCPWSEGHLLLSQYHDTEWGIPVHNDVKLFEFLVLDGLQAGLSWLTILKKREAFKEVFENFDFNKLALYNNDQLEEILKNPRIIRNRLKVYAVRKNAIAFLKVREEFGTFDTYLWSFVKNRPIRNQWATESEIPARTPLAELISKDLKKRSFTFVGPTIVYAFMQAMGMVNDHITTCFRHHP